MSPVNHASATSSPLRRALRRHQRGAFVIAGTAVVAAATLVPRGDELLLIHVRNRDIERARDVLGWATRRGASSAASVVAHGELYLLEGHVDEALQEMEAYVAAHADDVAAWRRLAALYANAQRLHDQIRALSHVYRLEPSGSLARELSVFHRWTADEAGEASVLVDLVSTGQATPGEYLRAATLTAALGRLADAAHLLEQLRRASPDAFDYPAMELYASLLVDLGEASRLGELLQSLPLARREPDVLVTLAGTLLAWNEADAAVALVAVPAGVTPTPSLLAARARVAQGTRHAATVVRELDARDAAALLPPDVLEPLVHLALSTGDYEAVAAVLARGERAPASPLIATAIGHALSHDARDRAQWLVEQLGDDSLFESPLLALELAAGRGDAARGQHWIGVLDERDTLTPDEIGATAQFEVSLGFEHDAVARLLRLARTGSAPAWALGDLARLAAATGQVDDALQALAPDEASRVMPAARVAWVHLAMETGRTDLVLSWLAGPSIDAADAAALRDAYVLLADRHGPPAALAASEPLLRVSAEETDVLLAARARVSADRPADALGLLRTVAHVSEDAQRTYESALYSVLVAGGPGASDASAGAVPAVAGVREEVRRVFLPRLRGGAIDGDHRAMLVEGLWFAGERQTIVGEIAALAADDLDRWLAPLVESAGTPAARVRAAAVVAAALGPAPVIESGAPVPTLDPAAAEPPSRRAYVDRVRALLQLAPHDPRTFAHLAHLATSVGGGWVFSYDEALAARARTADRVALWFRVGRSSTLAPEARRGAVARLLELGAIGDAVAVVRDLADASGPEGADVQQLLFLWGPRPARPALDWLAARLRVAGPEDRAAWTRHLVSVGAGDVVLAVTPYLPEDAPSALIAAWLDAHRSAGDTRIGRAALAHALSRAGARVDAVRTVARIALADGDAAMAVRGFGALEALAAEDLEAHRWLGTLAFYEGRTADARRHLDTYVRAGGVDAEPLYQLGELAAAAGEPAADGFYRRALTALDAPEPGAAQQVLLANVLVRLGARERATRTFEALLEADPAADHVRADYVSALLQWGDYDRARVVLQLP